MLTIRHIIDLLFFATPVTLDVFAACLYAAALRFAVSLIVYAFRHFHYAAAFASLPLRFFFAMYAMPAFSPPLIFRFLFSMPLR